MNEDPDSTPRYPVRLVAARTGLSAHVLRAWERRYQVVTPSRSEGGQRLYSDLDVERLRLLRRLTEWGHAIGTIAGLPLAELTRLDQQSAGAPAGTGPSEESGPAESARTAVEAALHAARRLDAAALQAVLERAAVTQGIAVFVDDVVAPVIAEIGHGWMDGSVTVAQEHMATAVIRRVLGWLLSVFELHGSARQTVVARRLLVATPPGQVHELGALLAAVTAAAEGWTVTYLGPDLPTDELLTAARQTAADAVALSLVYAGGDGSPLASLREVRAGLPRSVPLMVGGAAIRPLREEVAGDGVRVIDSLAEFRMELQRLGAPAADREPARA
jgi:DNA-binding transcriptional MerR regulator/methylmalonyl-CoA mutase cobalamin-binding subunit